MGDQRLRIDRRNAGYSLHRTGGKQVARPSAEPGSYHHVDAVCAEPLGKEPRNMLRCGNNFPAQNISLFEVSIYKQELFRMPKVLR